MQEKFEKRKKPGALLNRPKGIFDVPGEIPLKEMDRGYRRAFPEMEGRGAGILSQIIEAKKGEKMTPSFLEQLKGLDPVKLKEILNLIRAERRRTNPNVSNSKVDDWYAYNEKNQNEM